MATLLEKAIARIRSIGDHLCIAQVYAFDDYDAATGDATELCNRLGIPVTEDVVIEFPVKQTLAPLAPARLAKLAKQLGASLPDDYTRLLTEFGTFHLPGKSAVCFYSPETAIAVTRGAWCFKLPARSMPALAISSYHRHCDGDCIGFLRAGKSFSPEVYLFKHDLREFGGHPKKWTEKIAESLPEFIVSYIDSLP